MELRIYVTILKYILENILLYFKLLINHNLWLIVKTKHSRLELNHSGCNQTNNFCERLCFICSCHTKNYINAMVSFFKGCLNVSVNCCVYGVGIICYWILNKIIFWLLYSQIVVFVSKDRYTHFPLLRYMLTICLPIKTVYVTKIFCENYNSGFIFINHMCIWTILRCSKYKQGLSLKNYGRYRVFYV